MPTAKKAAVIEDLTEKLARANAAALIDYRGLTVAEISDLRRRLRQREVELEVTKNTLLREAAHRTNMMDLDELFVGPTAVAFIYGDEPTGTKTLNDFFRTARVGEIKSGILRGGRRLTAEQFTRLADLPSRQVLLAQIAGLLQSPMAQLAALLNAPAQQLAYALAALVDKGGAAGAGIDVGEPAGATEAGPEAPVGAAEPAGAAELAGPEAPAGAAELVGPEAPAGAAELVGPEAPAGAAELAGPEAPAGAAEPAPTAATETPEATAEAPAPAAEAVPASPTAEPPAEVSTADVSSAPEEEGGAAAEVATPTAEASGTAPSAQEAAEDVSSAPESEGSAGAQP